MPITLDVPFVTQLEIGGHLKGGLIDRLRGKKGETIDDPTGCWYASACMVGYYFEKGPRLGVPEIYTRNLADGRMGHHATGSGPADIAAANHHELLAAREKLSPVPQCEGAHAYTVDEIEGLLKKNGPIFMYWMKSHGGSSYGHASVIIGVTKKEIIFHDPEKAPKSKMAIDKFNSVRQKWKYALMQRQK